MPFEGSHCAAAPSMRPLRDGSPRNRNPRTMSGGEPSSIKRFFRCVAGAPVPEGKFRLTRVVVARFWMYDRIMYPHILSLYRPIGTRQAAAKSRRRAARERSWCGSVPCIIQEMAPADVQRRTRAGAYNRKYSSGNPPTAGYRTRIFSAGHAGRERPARPKILAKAANCLDLRGGDPCNECANCRAIDAGTAPDVLEIDAASNNSVDDIRDLRDEVVYPPAILKKRVYIIDEVHMLSASAFNALLKTLEEPPEHVIFILATTELASIPATILSRCLRFEF